MFKLIGKLRGKLVSVGNLLVVIVASGLFAACSVSTPDIPVTPTATLEKRTATPTTSIPTPPLTATAFGTLTRPVTPSPESCLVAYSEKNADNINDIFVRSCDGSNVRRITHERLSTGHEPSWSPDGQRLVFDDSKIDTTIPKSVASSLYIVNIDGSGLTKLAIGTSDGWFPSWSPDGNHIVFHGGGAEISTIHPDGTKLTHILHSGKLIGPGSVQMYADQLVWSPDSQRIAFIASPDGSQKTPSPGLLEYRFYVVNVDGSGLVELFAFKSKVHKGGHGWPAWSPDGKQVAFEMRADDQSERKRYLVNSDGSGGQKEIGSIPESWYPWYWPQWDKMPALETVKMGDQARAFADPILKAIEGRKPDFVDDFLTAGKGWDVGNQDEGEWFVIENGVARLGVSSFDLTIGNQALNRKDFVLQLEARVVKGEKAILNINFHNLSSEYWFYVTFNSASGGCWSVDKRMNGQQTAFASGRGIVNPFGEMTQVLIVAKGSQAAVYLNGTPIAYFEDADFDVSGGTGLFCQSESEAVCEFDNVEFWNLANIPNLP